MNRLFYATVESSSPRLCSFLFFFHHINASVCHVKKKLSRVDPAAKLRPATYERMKNLILISSERLFCVSSKFISVLSLSFSFYSIIFIFMECQAFSITRWFILWPSLLSLGEGRSGESIVDECCKKWNPLKLIVRALWLTPSLPPVLPSIEKLSHCGIALKMFNFFRLLYVQKISHLISHIKKCESLTHTRDGRKQRVNKKWWRRKRVCGSRAERMNDTEKTKGREKIIWNKINFYVCESFFLFSKNVWLLS